MGFYLSIVVLPMIQFCIFYIGVNINSVLMAFQKYENGAFVWAGLVNFKQIFVEFGEKRYMLKSLLNSLEFYGIGLLTMVMAMFFSFYIYKKKPLSGAFRVILFLPHIVSNITFVLMYKYFTDNAIPEIVRLLTGNQPAGLIANPQTAKGAIIFFCVFTGFGTQLLMFTGAMSGINESIIEAAQLDGITAVKELFLIDIPMIFPTVSTFLIVGVVGIFTNQMSLFSFFGTGADPSLYTFGYMLYRGIKKATMSDYSYLSALGLLFTLVSVPLTFAVKKLLARVDPFV